MSCLTLLHAEIALRNVEEEIAAAGHWLGGQRTGPSAAGMHSLSPSRHIQGPGSLAGCSQSTGGQGRTWEMHPGNK